MDWKIKLGIRSLIFLSLFAKAFAKPVIETISDVSSNTDLAFRNPEENHGMFEGDIMELPNPRAKNGIKATDSHWPSGEIPYIITNSYTDAKVTDLHEALAAVTTATRINTKDCITFRPAQENETHLEIHFNRSKDSGCSTRTVGYMQGKGNFINLGPRCKKGNMIHELLHAIGFWHEQSRPDRDDYINILLDNIITRKHSQYAKKSTAMATTLNQRYDYGSIMHYSEFSSNSIKPYCLKAFEPKYPSYNIGQRDKLSEIDIRKIQILYQCRRPDPSFEGIKYKSTPFPSPIPNADNCTFETDFCDWTQSESATLKWTRHKGDTDTEGTGPQCARYHENGYYIYVEATNNTDKVAKLRSKLYKAGKYCVDFLYHMYDTTGNEMGSLKLKVLDTNATHPTTVRSYGFKHFNYDLWIPSRASLREISHDFHLSFEAKINGYHSDIAIDSLLVYPGTCV